MRSWPRLVALALGLIPVVLLALMATSILWRSVDAVTKVGSRPEFPATAEAAGVPEGNCGNAEAVDNDGDGLVNDGCPASGTPETVAQCVAGNSTDDDGDNRVNDGCSVNVADYGAVSVGRVTNGFRSLFGTDFSTIYSSGIGRYGLRPAMIGTFSVTFIALLIALPVSLAMAVFAAEFPLGFLGRGLRLVLGVLAGIPPIVYALMAVVFVTPFMQPKFTAGFTFSSPDTAKIGVAPENWPANGVPWNQGAFPWDPSGQDNSVLLAGIVLSLLVIPFLAPLMEDAIRNVPREPKEASLALGANRWHTLRRITLPRAMPGIVAATGLGTLKVLGDVMIVLFIVGFEANMPTPAFDVLERTGPLTSTGAALVGGFTSPEACRAPILGGPGDCTVGYFSASLLLVAAVVIVTLTTVLEGVFRRRVVV